MNCHSAKKSSINCLGLEKNSSRCTDEIIIDTEKLMQVHIFFRKFVTALVEIHKIRSTKIEAGKLAEALCGPRDADRLVETTNLAKPTPKGGEDFKVLLVNHLNRLSDSVKSFVKDQFVYQSLCEEDRRELMARNSKLFAQYVLAR